MLWTFAAVAVLAAEFARAMRDEAVSTRNFKESTQARLIAVAAINEVILALQAEREKERPIEDEEDEEDPDPVRSLGRGDGEWVEGSFRGHAYQVRVSDEGGKLNLNQVDSPTLRIMFENLDIEESEAEIIADSILDWRDDDDFHQPNGAESDYYESLERPYRAKNAGFDTLEELMLVRGVTRDLFYGDDERPGFRELFSVFNKGKTVNAKTVTPGLMRALAGFDEESAEHFRTERTRPSTAAASVEELKAAAGNAGVRLTNAIPQQMTIEARVRDASETLVLAQVGAVINLASDGDGLKLFRWYDSIFEEADEPGGASAAEADAG